MLKVWLLLLLFLSGCASAPFDYPRNETRVVPASDTTRMGQFYARWLQQHGENSGFVGLSSGNDALGARLRLIESAEQTIDAQYFLLKPDEAGGLFVGKLLRAADRGVRVRLLIDDIFTPVKDSALALFNDHPNVEVRIFNPLARQGFKYVNLLWDFSRANRRMHNKSFTVDGSVSIVGGRNIADEYFEIKKDVEFNDFELLTLGPVVAEISTAFDLFWNSELAVPMEAFEADFDPAELTQWRSKMDAVVAGARESAYRRAIDTPLLRDITEGRVEPIAAPAYVVTDEPEKLVQKVGAREHQSLAEELSRQFDRAQREVIIISPYFVPGKEGVAAIEQWLQRGVRVVIVTNSLASTNHVPVHSGYARYRKPLLQAGAQLFELKSDAVLTSNAQGHAPGSRTLHTKAVVIDRKLLFIGSLNFDPRSIDINTEMGVFIAAPEAADTLASSVMRELVDMAYVVQLDSNGNLAWYYRRDGQQVDQEPDTGWWRRFSAGFYGVLPIEGQL